LPQSSSSGPSSLSQSSHIQSVEDGKGETYQEGESYLSTACVIPGDSFNILDWWKANEGAYPRLAQVAKDILAIQIAQVGVERVFNVAKDIIGNRRHHLAARTIQQIMILKQTICQEVDQPTTLADTDIAEDLAPIDEVSDLFELPASFVESVEQDISELASDVDTLDEESPLPPRKRLRPERYRD
jgi:hypothetical protein